jgi:hypothetical protein
MLIPLYYISDEDVWCFLRIKIKNNCYWIDWEALLDKEYNDITDKNNITLDNISHQNILCVKDNNYCYYNTDNKIVYNFDSKYNFLSVDGTSSLETLCNLNKNYNEFLYNMDDK